MQTQAPAPKVGEALERAKAALRKYLGIARRPELEKEAAVILENRIPELIINQPQGDVTRKVYGIYAPNKVSKRIKPQNLRPIQPDELVKVYDSVVAGLAESGRIIEQNLAQVAQYRPNVNQAQVNGLIYEAATDAFRDSGY
jgi:hypothetical protein